MKAKKMLICLFLLLLVGCNRTDPQNPVNEKKSITVETVNEYDLKYTVNASQEHSGIYVYTLDNGEWKNNLDTNWFVPQDSTTPFEFVIKSARVTVTAEYKGANGIDVDIYYKEIDHHLTAQCSFPENTIFRSFSNFQIKIDQTDADDVLLGYIAAVPSTLYDEDAKTAVDLTKDYLNHPELFEYEEARLFAVVFKY